VRKQSRCNAREQLALGQPVLHQAGMDVDPRAKSAMPSIASSWSWTAIGKRDRKSRIPIQRDESR